MAELPNHPVLDNPVALKLEVGDEQAHTVVFNGNLSMRTIIQKLIDAGYVSSAFQEISINTIAYPKPFSSYKLPMDAPLLDSDLVSFEKHFPEEGITEISI